VVDTVVRKRAEADSARRGRRAAGADEAAWRLGGRMDQRTFHKLRRIIYEASGISLGQNKLALVCARLNKRMRALGLTDYRAYLRRLREDTSGEELVQLLDVISTNVTHFFREADHFDLLRRLVAEWVSAGERRLRIWSAACSTGEEPYSIAITVLDALDGASVDVKILATDISTRVLRYALRGVYEPKRVQGVPRPMLERYFDKVCVDGETSYAVKDTLKRMVFFRRLNLSEPPFPMRGPFDVVFCRNVMIYFDDRVRKGVLDEVYRLLKPHGYLMVGHSESLAGRMGGFRSVKPSVYVRP